MRQSFGVKKIGQRTAAALLLGSTALAATVLSSAPAYAQQAKSYNIPAGALTDVLNHYAREAGVQLSYRANLSASLSSNGLKGQFAAAEGLSHILAGTGLTFRKTGSQSYTIERAPQVSDNVVTLNTLRVEGASDTAPNDADTAGNNGRVAGWDGTSGSVYRTAGSVNVITRETLEAYPVSTPADMLRGTAGVISAEARTGGGLDVNIRGLQGQGRVPVTVDGAINGTSVYRGYQGVSNRSFVDPDFISHVAIEKGPSMANAISGGIGGSVAMSTIGVNDILAADDDFGLRFKLGVSTNSVAPGSSMSSNLLGARSSYGDHYAATRERDRPGAFMPTGGSASMVLARRGADVDVVAGYSFRKMGNYFAGKNGKDAPQETDTPSAYCASNPAETSMRALCERAVQFYDGYGLTTFVGGEEVHNTSAETQSALVKVTIRPIDDHVVELGYGGFWNRYGENYPGSLSNAKGIVYQNNLLSKSNLDRFTARYRWNPAGDLVDLKINAWLSKLTESAPSLANSDPSVRYMDSWGMDLTNSSVINTGLGLLSADYGASYLHEKAGPVGEWKGNSSIPPGREGTRKEWSLFLDSALEPTDWLRLSAGARYQSYDLMDRQSGRVINSDVLNRSEDAFNYSLGATLAPVDGVQIFATYKHASRLPSLLEATAGFFMIANPDLRKETAHNWEYGASFSQNGLLSEQDQFGAKIAWFDNQVQDFISRKYLSNLYAMQMYNIDRAKMRGLEGSISYQRGGLSVDASATYYDRILYCRVDQPCIASTLASDYATNTVPPKWSASVSISQKLWDDRAKIGARFTYIGKRPIDAEVPVSGWSPLISAINWNPYALVDLSGQFQLTDGLSLDMSVDNLTDRYYVEPMSAAYVPAPGRTVRIGVTGKLGSKSGIWPGNWFSSQGNDDAVDWTGPYVGANIGYGFGKTQGSVTDSAGNPADLVNDSRVDVSLRNMMAGFHAGYQYQLPSNIILGVEADIAGGNLGGWTSVGITETSTYVAALQNSGKLESDTRYAWDSMMTLRGKLGYSLGQSLIYGTGGIAWLRETDKRNQYRSGGGGDRGINNIVEHYFEEKVRHNRQGWIAGFGLERALGRNWSLRTEYSYARFGQKDFAFDNARAGISQQWSSVSFARDPVTGAILRDPTTNQPIRITEGDEGKSNMVRGRVQRTSADLHSVRMGISYRF